MPEDLRAWAAWYLASTSGFLPSMLLLELDMFLKQVKEFED